MLQGTTMNNIHTTIIRKVQSKDFKALLQKCQAYTKVRNIV